MCKFMKKNITLLLSVLAMLLAFSLVAKAEIVSPTAKMGLVENGEKQVLIEAGKLSDGDEVDRFYRYKFEKYGDETYTKNANLITATDAGEYLIEWQLVSVKGGDENVLDAGIIKAIMYEDKTRPNVETGNDDNRRTAIGMFAILAAAVILIGAVAIKERIGE